MEKRRDAIYHIMSHVRSVDTKPEIKLRKALWHLGIRYRKNDKTLPGKPDIVITKCKIAVFVDGDFWHGRENYKVKSNGAYWYPKLKRNVERDKEVNDQLTEMGWLVLRFWASDLKKDFTGCVEKILAEIPDCRRHDEAKMKDE